MNETGAAAVAAAMAKKAAAAETFKIGLRALFSSKNEVLFQTADASGFYACELQAPLGTPLKKIELVLMGFPAFFSTSSNSLAANTKRERGPCISYVLFTLSKIVLSKKLG